MQKDLPDKTIRSPAVPDGFPEEKPAQKGGPIPRSTPEAAAAMTLREALSWRLLAAGGAGLLVGALSFHSLFSEWSVFPREAMIALEEDQVRALCRSSGTPLKEILERAQAAGATAVLARDQTLAEAVREGRFLYFPKGQVRAFQAIGLLDPTAPFPEDTLWIPDVRAARGLSRILRDAGLRFSTETASGFAVFSAAEGFDLDRIRAGPDPAFLAAVRSARLTPVYRIRRWDPYEAAVLRGAGQEDFPRWAYADMGLRDAEALASSGEVGLVDQGVFFKVSRREEGLSFPSAGAFAGNAVEVELAAEGTGEPSRVLRRAVERGWPRLLVLSLPEGAGVEASLRALRAASAGVRAAGMTATSGNGSRPAHNKNLPAPRPWLRLPVALGFAVFACLASLGLALEVLRRCLQSPRWPLAAPVWQLAASYAAVSAAAVLGGLLTHGLVFPSSPGTSMDGLVTLPFVIAAAVLYRRPLARFWKRFDRPLTLSDAAIAAACLALVWILWAGAFGAREIAEDWSASWRFFFVGAPCLMAGFWIRCRKTSGLQGIIEDERPLLLLGLWAPVELVRQFALSSAPFWTLLGASLEDVFAGALVGALALAALALYETRFCSRTFRARWVQRP